MYQRNTLSEETVLLTPGDFTHTFPVGHSMAYMMVMGAGGAGGGGYTAGLAGSNRSGGGGGGSGSIASTIMPLCLLPRTIFGRVGFGGIGGAPGVAGTSGEKSRLSISNDLNDLRSTIIISGNTAAAGGGAGSASSGFAGTNESIANISLCPVGSIGSLAFSTGKPGVGGSVSSVAAYTVNAAASGSPIMNGGCGGAGILSTNVPYTAAGYTFGGEFLEISDTVATPAGANGMDGYVIEPFNIGLGGFGGSASITAVGGNGGKGARGCGGGGGAAGTSLGFGAGSGGNGGDGMVIIVSW